MLQSVEGNVMKKILILVIGVLLLMFFSGNGICVVQKLWVSSTGAKLKLDNTSSSKTIAELRVGTELTVIQFKKRWYEVSTPFGKKGWIYRGKVSTTQPPKEEKKKGGGLGNLLGDLSGSNIQANNADTARSIRGLSPEADEYAKQSGTPKQHKQALDRVIASKTTKTELERFLKNGKIGEYAE